jgi:hypothetical protein
MRCLTSLLFLVSFSAVPAIAGDFDEGKPLQCFVGEIQECQPARECMRFTPAEIDLPEIIQIDFEAKELRGVTAEGRQVRTPVRSITKEGGSVSLQGHENGRSFSIVIDAATGKLSGAATEPGGGFLVFGTCVAR